MKHTFRLRAPPSIIGLICHVCLYFQNNIFVTPKRITGFPVLMRSPGKHHYSGQHHNTILNTIYSSCMCFENYWLFLTIIFIKLSGCLFVSLSVCPDVFFLYCDLPSPFPLFARPPKNRDLRDVKNVLKIFKVCLVVELAQIF